MWGGNRFVAGGSTIAYSAGGDRWQRARTSVDGKFHAEAWNGERYVAAGRNGLIMYSDDGDRWERAVDSATEEALEDVAWNGERFVAVSYEGVTRYSADGDRWEPAHKVPRSIRCRCCLGSRALVAVGRNGTIIVSP